MMSAISITAITTKGEARRKYLPAEIRNLSKNAQEWPTMIIESSDCGRMEATQRRGEPSFDTAMTVLRVGYST
jgi:hypothetical protein